MRRRKDRGADIPVCAAPRMTAEERRVWSVLRGHKGQDHAITRARLAEATGLDDRRMRQVLAHLRKRHGRPIGSVSSPPGGYYVIRQAREARSVLRQYWRRVLDQLETIQVLERKQLPELVGQLSMRLAERGKAE